MREVADLTIAVANTGDPADPAQFSGTPAGLLGGLAAIGVRAEPVAGQPPQAWRPWIERAAVAARLRPRDLGDVRAAVAREWFPALLDGPMQAVRQRRVATGLRRLGPVDGIVAHGTELLMPAGVPSVTYEDATVLLARRHWAWSHLEHASEDDVARYVRRSRTAYVRARACCTMSHWAAASLVDDYGVDPERVHVVGVGAVRRLRPPAVRDWGVPRFLFVGFDWERKNGPALVRAFAAVRERHPGATLDVVGGHPRLDAPGVTGHGPIGLDDPEAEARLQALFDVATCFVMPSLHEPAGQAYIEAGTAGVPSIGTSDGGAATVIGAGGMVVDPRDEAAVAEAMLALADGERAAALGAAALEHAALLTWPMVAQRLVRALAPAEVDVRGLAAFL